MAGDATLIGTRGVYRAEVEARLPYKVFDADNHFYPPEDAETRHLEPEFLERAFPSGKTHLTPVDVVGDEHKAKTIGEHPVPEGGHGGVNPLELPEMEGDIPVPGAMLNKLNPMRDLDTEARAKLVETYRHMEPAFQHRDRRLDLMDEQGVAAAVLHGGSRAFKHAFDQGDLEAGYAVARAHNKWIQDDWGFAYKDRIFTPAYIPLIEVDHALAELDRVMSEGVKLIGLETGSQGGRSPADPYFDPFWSRVNEAGFPIVIHLGGHFAYRGVDWSEDPNTPYKEFDGFQWVCYWSDFPIMETVTALIFHSFFERFPNSKALIAEHGTVWLPYLLRKLDHAHLLGRQPKWGGQLPARPSEIFRERFVVAPFPEENVQRAIDVIGTDCLVFGSDFPHSEGLPDPVQYATQLKDLPEPTVRAIMRDNLARFLGMAA
jgi:predicted TIM-barrel fold metal-dependent hydrolase